MSANAVLQIALIFTLLTTRAASQDLELQTVSRIGNKTYVSQVTTKMLQDTPAWKRASPNPPIDARTALRLATAEVLQIVSLDRCELRSIELRPRLADRWLYVVTMDVYPDSSKVVIGSTFELQILVLMNGVAVRPKRLEK